MSEATQEIPRAWIDNYANSLNSISQANKNLLASCLEHIDYSDKVSAVRSIVRLMEVICQESTRQASVMAAAFYDGIRKAQGLSDEFSATTIGYNAAATDSAVRGAAARLASSSGTYAGGSAAARRMLASRVGYETKAAAGNTIYSNMARDPRTPAYARVPRFTPTTYGHEIGDTHNKYLHNHGTCVFCGMLASRGFVYFNGKTAGADFGHYHDDCDCVIVPSWFKHPMVENYDPRDYMSDYDEYRKQDHTAHALYSADHGSEQYRRNQKDRSYGANEWGIFGNLRP
ncbi:MAG: hypothetical protein SOV20_08780 [Coriobacteriales bacterium]|nr:hypothetical protein [Coriobacteriaceae bacterium]MDY2723892.1 hypothetical protein [Coriobacteriales bacterium]